MRNLSHELNQVVRKQPKRKGGFSFLFFFLICLSPSFSWTLIVGEIWRLRASVVFFFSFISFAFKRQGCLLNLEPSRQYHKRSCKCLNRGLLDFGVPTPRPQEDRLSFLPRSFTPGYKCLEIFCASSPTCSSVFFLFLFLTPHLMALHCQSGWAKSRGTNLTRTAM